MTDALPWIALGALLVLSGSFSASETALFSLRGAERERASPRVRLLLADPRDLLLTILLGNLLVNLLFFATSATHFGGGSAQETLLTGLGTLVALLVLGEVLPKTLALRMPHLVSRLAALPLGVLVASSAPVRRMVGATLDLAHRALGESEREERKITPESLGAALSHSAAEGHLAAGEADLLAEIVELGSLRVREIMTPRVDMLAVDLEESAEDRALVLANAQERRVSWLPVIRGEADNVVGCVQLRDLMARPDRPIEQLVMPVKFVPEVANVLTMLSTLRQERIAEAVVVDEWGGTAGVVTLEDLFEEIVGELRVEGEPIENPVTALGDGRYRVTGGLPIRDWNELLEAEVVPNSFETVGGFVTALLGHIPRAGDRVELGGGLVCEVNGVRGRRVETLDIYLEGSDPPVPAAGSKVTP